MLPQTKEECIRWQEGILANTQKLIAEISDAKLKATARVAELEELLIHFSYEPMHRMLSMPEDKLNLLGFKIINGRVEG